MKSVCVLFILGFCAAWTAAAFLNHRPFPTYSLENMPDTEFTCRDKILGGYYADSETQCQMFHVCVKVAGIGVQDYRFLCPNGTAFDQDHQICAEWEDVDCDATTLYYSSDNFDLYRLGSGFESKAVKYGEDEETFALQRAETGDARINRDHQTQRVNQQKEINNPYYNQQKQQRPKANNNNNNNNDRDIFKGSSSSNFFNNRNNGKENDDDYDDNVNVNQDNDYAQRRKVVRKQQRRPQQQQQQEQKPAQQQQPPQEQPQRIRQKPQQQQSNTEKPQRPTGFINNFAGSSYIPTTSKPTTTTENQEYRDEPKRIRTRQRVTQNYNNADNFRTSQNTPTYTVSTPAPFRQTQQYNNPPTRQTTQFNNNNNQQYYSSTVAPKKETENYPSTFNNNNNQNFAKQQTKPTTTFNTQYDVPKVKGNKPTTPIGETENYPSNNPQYKTTFDKKPTTPFKQTENYPTTFSPKAKPFSATSNTQPLNNFPTTFAPRTNAGYTQITQQITNYNTKQSAAPNSPTPFAKQQQQQSNSTPRTTPFTQYTPTVPKINPTTPVSRSNRFDETSYDDGSYSTKYDYDGDKKDDEFLKTAHSQNIASSRNEFAKSTKNVQQTTQKPYFESPRPFSVSPNTPKVPATTKTTSRPQQQQQQQQRQQQPQQQQQQNNKQPPPPPKTTKTKDASYDYAYYDTNASSEPDYVIDTEFKKSTVKN